ncbi:MAG: 30S ribosomal protein S4e [Halobacteriales archaeon]
MSNHQKRLSAPTSWPVGRKTETFTVKADAGPHGEDGVPLLILLRDVLGYVDSRKEAQYALDQDSVLINGTVASDVTRPIGMFDILAFEERAENYRVFPDEGGRLALTPIDADAAGSKLGKITEKRLVPGGDTQLTMHDGETLLVAEDAYTPGDSLVIGNEDGSVIAHFPYEEGALVTAVDGQHAGEIGTVTSIEVTPGSGSNAVTVETGEGAFETIEEYVVVIDENFTDDDEAAETSEEGELEDIAGVGPAKADALREAGFESVADVREATTGDLSEAEGVGESLAEQIKDDVGGADA